VTLDGLLRPVRRSLQARVALTVLVLSAVCLTVVGLLLTSAVRRGVFDARVDDVLREAARAASTAQQDFDAAGTHSPLAAETMARDTITSVFTVGSSADAVALLPPADAGAGAVSAIFTDQGLWDLDTGQLRAEAERSGQQVWQSVGLPARNGAVQPGVAVASPVHLASGSYVLVLVYGLGSEQATVDLVGRIMAAAAVAVMVILVLVTWVATRQVVRPVQAAAQVAQQLAAGALGERMVVRGRDEMATLAGSFNAMAESMQHHIEQMEHLSNLQRRFVADVSHELRTPLATTRMAGDVLYQGRAVFPPALARSAELLSGQLDRLDALLADLLEISRLDAGAAQVEAEQVDLRQLAESTIEQVAPLAESKGVELRRHFDPDPCRAWVDPRRIRRVLRNLLVNAIEHAESAPVDVVVEADEQSVVVTVRDYGVGLSKEQAALVFDRFWRADPARARTTGGSGLGLSIALEDAKAHGGTIDASGRLGQGASFRLTLPREGGPKP
jgi:two-component system sensor histidine kinase MtrB